MDGRAGACIGAEGNQSAIILYQYIINTPSTHMRVLSAANIPNMALWGAHGLDFVAK